SEMQADRCVLILDEDAGADDAADKLTSLGATEAMLRDLLVYLPPGGRNLVAQRGQLFGLTRERAPSLVIVDAAADHFAAAGMEEDKARDVTAFINAALKPLAQQHRAAVVVIDHKTKSDPQSRFARASGAKLAKTDVGYNVSAPE